eukprot:scaffold58068_cov31-Tisochrysis_lutea.AAC.4
MQPPRQLGPVLLPKCGQPHSRQAGILEWALRVLCEKIRWRTESRYTRRDAEPARAMLPQCHEDR